MGAKTRQIVTNSPKAEVGEIDTSSPFESVKAAVSLFGEGASSVEKSTARKPKPQSAEKSFAKETQLHIAQKDLNKLKEQLLNAETTKVQALSELERAKTTVEDLTHKLESLNKSKETSIAATESAKAQSKQLEVSSNCGSGTDVSSRQELDTAREQYAVSIAELDAAKQELRTIHKEFDASMKAQTSAFHQEAEAKRSADSNRPKTTQFLKDITAANESLMHVKLATEQAQQEESKIRSEKEARRQSYRQASEETEKKLASLKEEFDPEFKKNIEVKLAETTADIGTIRKDMEDGRASEVEAVTTVTTELDGAKGVLQKLADEENSLKGLLESLRLELEAVKNDHSELNEKDAEAESLVGSLHVQLQKYKAELESAMATESKASSSSDYLTSALLQLSAESEAELQEAESMKRKTEDLKQEAEAARAALSEAEKKLQSALSDAETAKAAEARALDQIKELSERANTSRSSTSEHGAKIAISVEEHESLIRKVRESEELAEMKVAAAMAQVEAVRASEDEVVKRMEAVRNEMEEMGKAKGEALKRAGMAESAKKAVEGELLRWREREQKKAAEAASRILSETIQQKEQPPSRAEVPATVVKTVAQPRVYRPTVLKKTLLPSFRSMFQRRKSQVDG